MMLSEGGLMFSDLLAALKALGSGFSWAVQLQAEKRKRFAALCENISNVLQQYANADQSRRQSMNLCAELREYVLPIRELASGTLAPPEIARVADALDHVCDAWSRLDEAATRRTHVDADDVDQIVEASGMFRGLANRLRAV
jgi:hypothetical protein